MQLRIDGKRVEASEGQTLLEAARERYPPHYHVVLFPDPYLDYVEAKAGETVVAEYRPQPAASKAP